MTPNDSKHTAKLIQEGFEWSWKFKEIYGFWFWVNHRDPYNLVELKTICQEECAKIKSNATN